MGERRFKIVTYIWCEQALQRKKAQHLHLNYDTRINTTQIQ